MDDGLIGEILQVHAQGKQDQRAGGEDLIVLGVHLFDLMRYFAADALWCSACVLQDGQEITLRHAHGATENIGPIAGNNIAGQFAFPAGVHGTFTSRGKNRDIVGPWGLELVGTKGRVRVLTEMIPSIYTLTTAKWEGSLKTDAWRLWENDPSLNFSVQQRNMQSANARVVNDWLEAIRLNRDPACSGYAGMKALEMAHAVFAAGLARTRVEIPLKDRLHPLRQSI